MIIVRMQVFSFLHVGERTFGAMDITHNRCEYDKVWGRQPAVSLKLSMRPVEESRHSLSGFSVECC